MIAFCKVCQKVPKMANMLEGGGRTPLLTPLELENIGFKIVAYPLSLLGVSIRAMQDALLALKSGRFPRPGSLPSFDEIKDVVGFNSYYKEEEHYSLVYPTIIPPAEATDPAQSQEDISSLNMTEERVTDRTLNSIAEQTVGPWGVKSGSEDSTVASDQEQPSKETEATYIIPNVIENADGSNRRSSQPGIWSRVLRVKITGSGGLVKLDVRIPAGFLDGLTRTVPGIAGFNIGSLVNEAASNMDGKFKSGQQLVDIMDRGGDRFQVFLE
ncbi:hypothetical protein O6H91_03G050800 [Diphasiastrum complanatum]|nr:hypothetical protein O6H91_03G050800 [Diphasiastrum complanatum]